MVIRETTYPIIHYGLPYNRDGNVRFLVSVITRVGSKGRYPSFPNLSTGVTTRSKIAFVSSCNFNVHLSVGFALLSICPIAGLFPCP